MIFFLIISAITITIGALGIYQDLSIILSVANMLLYLGFNLIKGEKVKTPKTLILYVLFLLSTVIHYLIFKGDFIYILLFLTGGFQWILIYNFKKDTEKYFLYFLIFLGLLMTGLFILTGGQGTTWLTSKQNLFRPIQPTIHNHMGDLWAVILAGVFYTATKKLRAWHIPLTIFGIATIAQSFSRSAAVALIIAVLYTLSKTIKPTTVKKYYIPILVIGFAIFFYFSAFKTTIFSRPYFLESILSIIKYPLGTGLGNFAKITTESTLTHNILLEILSGLGIFSILFFNWIYKLFKEFVNSEDSIFKIIVLTILVNFCLDTTYTIPAMMWILFSSLAFI